MSSWGESSSRISEISDQLSHIKVDQWHNIEPVDPNNPNVQIIQSVCEKFSFEQGERPFAEVPRKNLTIGLIQAEGHHPLYVVYQRKGLGPVRYGIQINPVSLDEEYVIDTGETPDGRPLYMTVPVDVGSRHLRKAKVYEGTHWVIGDQVFCSPDGELVEKADSMDLRSDTILSVVLLDTMGLTRFDLGKSIRGIDILMESQSPSE